MATGMIRGLAAFAGGAAAAFVASRVLPPIVAQAAGTAGMMGNRDAFDVLEDDHRAILSLLDSMERSEPDAAFTRGQLFLRLKRRLAAHALAEEDVVYPLLHGKADEAGDAMHLYSEHAEIKMHLHALEEMPKTDHQWIGKVRSLKSLIERHVQQEEEVDFPKLRAMLDERAAARLNGSVRREKAMLL